MEIRIDFRYALTESIRYLFNIHSGKKIIVQKIILPSLKGKTVLDFGCGTGFYSSLFADVARSVYAIDISAASLSIAREINSKENISYGENIPDDNFDVVICNDSLEMNENTAELVKILLSKGSLLYVISPNFNQKNNIFSRLLKHVDALSLLKDEALQIIRDLENPKQGYKKLYNKSSNRVFETILNESKLKFKKKFFSLQKMCFTDLFFNNTAYCNHVLYIVEK